jgi:hypothetical protein
MRDDGGDLRGFAEGELAGIDDEGNPDDEGKDDEADEEDEGGAVDEADAGWELTSAEGLDGFV